MENNKLQRYYGSWKILDSNDLFQGVLNINSAEGFAYLELVIPASYSNPLPNPPYRGSIPFICGTLITGEKICLYKCETGAEYLRIPHYNTQLIYAEYLFRGLEVSTEAEIKFHRVRFDFGNILSWADLCHYELDLNKGPGFAVSWIPSASLTFNLDNNTKIAFIPSYNEISIKEFEKENSLTQRLWVQFEYTELTNLDVILEDAKRIMYLIGLGINNKVEIEDLEYSHSSITERYFDDKGNLKIVSPFLPMFMRSNSNTITQCDLPHTFVFRLKDVDEGIFRSWNENYSKLEPILDLYFYSFSKIPISPVALFLNLIRALEAYHTRFITNDIRNFKKRIKKLIDKLRTQEDKPSCWKRVFGDIEQQPGSSIYLRFRLVDLFFAEGDIPCQPSKYEITDYISKIVNSRNYYTHYDEHKLDNAFSPEELPLINAHLRALLEYHILTLIGFDRDIETNRVREIIKKVDEKHYKENNLNKNF
ncbi:MAG: hypothetical protein Q4E09_06645 [Eubacteriales bacterium]|nr:hypothetical protein [Eubacteriales bacterium]